MIRVLWRRRARSRGSKGVSSVIGAITLLIVGLMISTNVFLWALQQNTFYSQKVIESNQLDTDRFSEEITITSGVYSVDDDEVQVNATLINDGPVAVQILALWVVDASVDAYNFTNDFSIDSVTNFNPGDSGKISGTVGIDGADSTHTFDTWFVTARGNLISFEEDLWRPPVQSFGVFSLDWFFFKYADEQTSGELRSAGLIDVDDDYVSFHLKVINNYEENVTILDRSMLMLLIPWAEPIFYVVEAVDYTGWTPQITAYDNSDPIIVRPHETVTLIFAAEKYGGTQWNWDTDGRSLFGVGWGGSEDIGAIAMAGLIFTMESDPSEVYGQGLSFQALIISVGDWPW